MAKEKNRNTEKTRKKSKKKNNTQNKNNNTKIKRKVSLLIKLYKAIKQIKKSTIITAIKVSFFIGFVIFILYIFESIQPKQKVQIERGGISQVIYDLKKQGYNVNFLDKYLLALMGNPKAGSIYFDKNKTLTRLSFLYKIANTKPENEYNQITLIPGETLDIFFEKIAKQINLNNTLLMNEYTKQSFYKEAGIIPDTYFVNSNMNEKELVAFLIKQSEEKYSKMAIKYFGTYNKEKWQKILTKASIIQKEAANENEMPIISSVIDNRIAKNMKLQMDGSLNYGIYSHMAVTPERIKSDNSTFNTYKNYGLPASPVCSVSQSAIEAAINPIKTDFLYFVKNKNGSHTFTKDFKSHRNAIEENKK